MKIKNKKKLKKYLKSKYGRKQAKHIYKLISLKIKQKNKEEKENAKK